MADQLAVPDFSDVASKLRERIKSAFVDLIPEERWDAMLKAEVEKFMTGTPASSDRYHNVIPAKPSEFSKISQEILGELVRAEAKQRFESVAPLVFETAVEEWIEANYERVLRDFFAELFKSCVSQFTSRLSMDVASMLQEFLRK